MKRKAILNTAIILLLCIAAICGYFFMRDVVTAQEEMSEYGGIREKYTSPLHEAGREAAVEPDDAQIPPERAGLPLVDADFGALLQANPDTAGWIAIPNTPISYPVVQAADNSRYLYTSFAGSRSRAGTPFADWQNDMRDLDTNTIIYGHNMGAGRDDMFSTLLGYKDYAYFMEHRYIQFDTIYHNHGFWEVFAVIEYDVRSDGFRPLQISFADDGGFMGWLGQIRERSIHWSDTGITPQDKILTLSTCDRGRYGSYGRLLVLAVNVQYGATG